MDSAMSSTSTSRLAEPLDAPKLSIIGCVVTHICNYEKQTNQSIITASRIAESRPTPSYQKG